MRGVCKRRTGGTFSNSIKKAPKGTAIPNGGKTKTTKFSLLEKQKNCNRKYIKTGEKYGFRKKIVKYD